MSWLIDTDALSESTRPNPDPSVRRWFAAHGDSALYLSAITLGELYKGAKRLPESRRRTRLSEWIELDLKKRFSDRILPVDLEVAEIWGQICADAERRGRELPVVDSLIAATALHHGMIVVTRNVAHFSLAGVPVENPWS